MNLILLFNEDFIDQRTVRITGRRMEHILKVHRAGSGDTLTAGLAGGLMGKGTLLAVEKGSVVMEVEFTQPPPPPLPVTLVLGLPRPKVFRRILQAATALGVKKIYLINAYRVEKSYWQSPFLDSAVIREQLVLGLEQAKDTVLPEVLLRPLFRPFAEDELPELVEDSSPLVAHPEAEEECPRSISGHATLAVGPEGGFIQYEIDKLSETGFRPVSLGSRILRVETALPALLGRLY